jgi:hypothetical protein
MSDLSEIAAPLPEDDFASNSLRNPVSSADFGLVPNGEYVTGLA